MPTDQDDLLAEIFRTDLHARCQWVRRRRFRECDWLDGYCINCARPMPTLDSYATTTGKIAP
jgi:hypothetical protein